MTLSVAVFDVGFIATKVVPAVLLVFVIILVIALFFPRWRRIVLIKAWPAVIGGLFVAYIVPSATEIYWKRQKDFETCLQDRAKRYDLVGSTARTYTSLFKIHTRLHQLANEWLDTEKAIRTQTRQCRSLQNVCAAHLAAIDTLRADLLKERIRLEGQIGADSALVSHYLPEAANKYYEVGTQYERHTSKTPTFLPAASDPLVQATEGLLHLMREEARKHDCR